MTGPRQPDAAAADADARGHARGASAATIALLLLLPVALLWPSLLGGEVFLPFSAATFPPFSTELTAKQVEALTEGANMDVTEVPITFVPELQHVRAELAAGRLPHWNPYAAFGAALLPTSVVGLMYPPNWPTLLGLDPTHGLAWNAYLALALAGLLMFGFVRALGFGHGAAALGAVAFAWSGTLTANLHFYQRVHALVWLPGMLWALTRTQQREGPARWRAAAGLALCLAMSWLAGFPAYAAAATAVAALWAAWLAAEQARTHGVRAGLRLLATSGAGAGLGLALAAVQLLPMFAFFPESNRDPDPTRDSIASQAFDPMGFLGYVLPDPFGTPAQPELPYDYSLLAWSLFSRSSWDTGIAFQPNYNFVEYTVYPGAVALVLAMVGLLAGRQRGRAFAATALALLFVLACAGPTTSALNDLPFVRSVPPMRFAGPACVLVALLAAAGVESLGRAPRRTRVAGGAAVLLAAACLAAHVLLGTRTPEEWLAHVTPDLLVRYHPRFPNATPELIQGWFGTRVSEAVALLRDNLTQAGVLLGLVGIALLVAPLALARARGATATSVALVGAAAVELVLFALPVNRSRPDVTLAAPALDLLRAERVAANAMGGFAVARGNDVAVLPTALPPCLLVPERIRDLHAYTFIDARSYRLWVALYGRDHMLRGYWPKAFPDDERLRRPLFDLLGVRYVLATVPLRFGGDEVAVPGSAAGSFHVYERPQALPRAFVVPAVRPLADEEAVIAAMIAPELVPRAAVFVTPDEHEALRAHAGAEGAERRGVRFVADTPTEVRLEVDPGPPGFLVMSDALMRGWTATVGGVPARIARGDLFMRVLPLGPDAAEVRFSYTPPRLVLGASVSALAAGLLVWLTLRGAQRAKRRGGEARGEAPTLA